MGGVWRDESKATEAPQKGMLEKLVGRWSVRVGFRRWMRRRVGCWGMSEEGYLRLVDWTGRHCARTKPGRSQADLAPVLERPPPLELDVENWLSTVERYGSLYHRVAGNVEKLREAAARVGQRWFRRRIAEGCAGGVSGGVRT